MCRTNSDYDLLCARLVSAANISHMKQSRRLQWFSTKQRCHFWSTRWLGFTDIFPMCIVSPPKPRENIIFSVSFAAIIFHISLQLYKWVCIDWSCIHVCVMKWSVVYPNRFKNRKVTQKWWKEMKLISLCRYTQSLSCRKRAVITKKKDRTKYGYVTVIKSLWQ